MESTTPSHLRPLRFSLRTLFVLVTLVAVFIGYHVDWIRKRQAFVVKNAETVAVIEGTMDSPINPPRFVVVPAPGLLFLFGERGRYRLDVSVTAPQREQFRLDEVELLDQAARLFSEAEILAIHLDAEDKWHVVRWNDERAAR